MANSLKTNPYIVDTAMTQSMKTSAGLPQNIPIFVTEMYWLTPVTVGDTFVFSDSTGTVRRTGRCEVASQSQIFRYDPPMSISDFTVGTLASGKLYISTL